MLKAEDVLEASLEQQSLIGVSFVVEIAPESRQPQHQVIFSCIVYRHVVKIITDCTFLAHVRLFAPICR